MTDFKQPKIKLPAIDLSYDGTFFTSNSHGDIYFSKDGGLAESTYVFCEGTHLADLMRQKSDNYCRDRVWYGLKSDGCACFAR